MASIDKTKPKPKPNPDLFYDSQLSTDSLCWILELDGEEILRGILPTTEFSYEINNVYESDFNLDMIAGYINKGLSTARSYYYKATNLEKINDNIIDPISKAGGGELGAVLGTAGDIVGGGAELAKGLGTKILGNIGGNVGLKGIGSGEQGGINLLHSRFISAFEHAKFWGGSTVNISFPTLETILFDDDSISLVERVKSLHDKFMNDIETTSGGGTKIWGFMKAPNDYRPDFTKQGLDNPEYPGTFQLHLGSQYLIKNLVVSSFQSNMSQYRRIKLDGSLSKGAAYSRITIGLELASFVTKKTLNDCLIELG